MVEILRLREHLGQQSRFLATDVDRHPFWLKDLAASGNLNRGFVTADFERELEGMPASMPPALRFASFRRRQLLRILIRDTLGLATLSETTWELSALAGAILNRALEETLGALATRHGMPTARICVIALGKLGGHELNYSSDIDLLFLYGFNGETEGPSTISYKEFFKNTAAQLSSLLSTHTPEGFCYRVDLRLRPEGKHGEVCIPLEAAKHYYEKRARDWELQMMIKARPVAGDLSLGASLLEFIEPLTYGTTLDFSAIETMSETRSRINEKLNSTKRGGLDIKLTRGGIRDIEFLVQCLQRLHGGRSPWVRHGGTLLALARLQDKGLISESEYSRLANAYTFLRHLEHRLQFRNDRQTHALPTSKEDLNALARRMPRQLGFEPTSAGLARTLEAHLEGVIDIYDRVVHAQQVRPLRADNPAAAAALAAGPQSNVLLALSTKARTFGARALAVVQRRRLKSFEHFLEAVESMPELLAAIESNAALQHNVIEVFDCSPFFAEHLARNPNLVLDLLPDAPALETPVDATSLRSYYRRAAMRIQAGSIVRSTPVFETLGQMSDLADSVIAKAYDLALAIPGAPSGPALAASHRMMVIALGRLGMCEFDLDSDADLLFVIPDEAAPEALGWTKVAERVIEILASYTSAGAIFSVDTRLRPSGREGGLVQTAGAFLDYFEKRAEAWEGIAYMKARAVAGDLDRATAFLGKLQQTDWRRWGQSGRSRRDLLDMRMRLEKEQGRGNPLKAGQGGYYDIDFLLLYLRLRSAGVFFRVLNTPERVDVLEKMGHLEREDAIFLREAAGFYRALDHGLRLYSGHAEGKLPAAEVKLEALAGLVSRWLPPSEDGLGLAERLAAVKDRTREIFLRFFG
jgi:glutamate-ammonia-ligase adenylyltransferase